MNELNPSAWFIPLGATSLTITLNPFGAGLALMVERGAPVNAHTQVFTGFCQDTPEEIDVQRHLLTAAPVYQQQYERLVDWLLVMDNDLFNAAQRQNAWMVKELVAAQWCAFTIRQIAEAAYQNYLERLNGNRS